MYKSCIAYVRKKQLYAKIGSGFVALRVDGMASHPNIKWESIEGCGSIKRNPTSGAWLTYNPRKRKPK